MITVSPMPNEFAPSHLGRIGWIHGCRTNDETNRLFIGHLTEQGHAVNEWTPTLTLLAMHCGMKPESYASMHSMLAVRCLATPPDRRHRYGDNSQAGVYAAINHGTLSQQPEARCCVHCIKEDLGHWKFSWYRRDHQLVGMDWCTLHRKPLMRVTASHPYLLAPHLWQEAGALETIDTCWPGLPEDGLVRRYLDLVQGFLLLTRSIDPLIFNQMLSDRAERMGYDTCRTPYRPNYISGFIERSAPAAWLSRHNILGTVGRRGGLRTGLNCFKESAKTVHSASVYAAMCAVLFETFEEAMRTISSADLKTWGRLGSRPPANAEVASPH